MTDAASEPREAPADGDGTTVALIRPDGTVLAVTDIAWLLRRHAVLDAEGMSGIVDLRRAIAAVAPSRAMPVSDRPGYRIADVVDVTAYLAPAGRPADHAGMT